jgi:dolichol-phosphate mannosyltransferase
MVKSLFELPVEDLRLLVIDDGSPDGTGVVAEQLAEQHPGRVHVIHREGKLGLGTAYLTGFRWALDQGAEIIIQMDADFSHDPKVIPELIGALNQADLAVGSRYVAGGSLDERWPFWRKWLSSFGNLYARIVLRMPVRDLTGGFRAWSREVMTAIPLERVKSEGYAFQVEMIYLADLLGYEISEVPIYFADRVEGESKMSLGIQIEAALRVWAILLEYADLRRRDHSAG